MEIFSSSIIAPAIDALNSNSPIGAAQLPAATASTQGAVLLGGSTATAAATVDQLSRRQVASWFVNDTLTSGRGIVFSNATRQNIAGVPVVQIAFEMVVPTVNPSASAYFFQFSSTAGDPGSFSWGLYGRITTAGALQIVALGANTGPDFRQFAVANFRSTYSGRRIRGLLEITNGSATAPVLTVEGSVVAGVSTTGAGTIPDWLSSSQAVTHFVSGGIWPTADHPHVVPILGAMSAGEASTWFSTGRLPAWVHAGGGAWTHNFTNNELPAVFVAREAIVPLSAQTSFTQSIYDLTVNPDGLAAMPTGATRALKFTTSGNNGYNFWTFQVPFRQTSFTFWYYVPTGQPDIQILANGIAAGNNLVITGSGSVKDAWTQITVSLFQPSAAGVMLVRTAAAGTAYLADVRGTTNGALTIPGVQGIGTARDLTTLGGTLPNQGRLVGVRPVLTGPAPRNIAIFPLSTTGAFLTLASTNPLAYTPQRIMRAEVVVDTAGADLTFRNNSSSANDIVTALTDIPSANTATALTLIAAQTRLAPGATVWGSLSAGTGFLIVETADTL